MNSRWQLKYIKRRREIVGTFMRHGLGYFMQRFGLRDRTAFASSRGIKQTAEESVFY